MQFIEWETPLRFVHASTEAARLILVIKESKLVNQNENQLKLKNQYFQPSPIMHSTYA